MKRRLLMTVMGFGLAVSAATAKPASIGGPTSDNGPDVLKKSQAAMKRVTHAKYSARFRGTGWVERFVPDVEGTTISGPRSEWDLDSFRSEVKLTPRGEDEALEFTVGCNGDVYFLIDPKTKTAYEDMDPAVLGSEGRNLQRLVMTAFNEDNPFGEDIASAMITGEETVEGVPCKIVTIEEKDGTKVEWFIGTKDYLPRRRRRILKNRQNADGPTGTTELTIAQLVVNPKLEGDPFKLSVPKGYTKSDDFAE